MRNKVHEVAQKYFEKTVVLLTHQVHVHKPGGVKVVMMYAHVFGDNSEQYGNVFTFIGVKNRENITIPIYTRRN
jgi:hypothetical protein